MSSAACAGEAGIAKRVYPHLLRHSIATTLLDSGQMPIYQVQKFLGHQRLSTTQIDAETSVRALATTTCARWARQVEPMAGMEAQLEQEPLDDVDAAERLPAEIEPAILRKYFSLTRADLDEVERCRGPANKLGFGVQLCTLRWRGHFLPDTRAVPPVVLEVLAPQLGLLPAAARRLPTR